MKPASGSALCLGVNKIASEWVIHHYLYMPSEDNTSVICLVHCEGRCKKCLVGTVCKAMDNSGKKKLMQRFLFSHK